MADFCIGQTAYQSRMMDGDTQTLVLKRLLPAFTALAGCAPTLGQLSASASAEPKEGDGAPAEDAEPASVQDLLMPVARELASLHDRDVQFIIMSCLGVTKREAAGNGVGWVDVVQRGVIQDQSDASFQRRLIIAWNVLGENFGEMLSSFGIDVDALTAAAPRKP